MLLSGSGVRAQDVAGPLRQVSGSSPFPDCTLDNTTGGGGQLFLHSEVEPYLTIDPTNPQRLIATWQQDRWSTGGARGQMIGISEDGGDTWESHVLQGVSACSGGLLRRASSPWVEFAADGTLVNSTLSVNPGSGGRSRVLASQSVDGGRTWMSPAILADDVFPFLHDKESITPDRLDPRRVYATWDRLDLSRARGPAMFTRSIDGGVTWEPATPIFDPGRGNQTIGAQILVLPDGTLVNFFNEVITLRGLMAFRISQVRSTDGGTTWLSPPTGLGVVPMDPVGVVDPEGENTVRDGSVLFDVAVDPSSGWVYAVWMDHLLSSPNVDSIAFSQSRDGGLTWSPPIAIDRTPNGPEVLRRQSFTPSVAVAPGGLVGVTYYDFRNDGPEPEALTDAWLVRCQSQAADCGQVSNWAVETRLTDESFDILRAPVANGYYLGDYTGLVGAPGGFVALFSMPHGTDRASAFARRVTVAERFAPQGAGWWRARVRAILTARGRMQLDAAEILRLLGDIRAVHDLFDDVVTLAALDAILAPPPPPDPREQMERQLMGLLLNVASGRLTPGAAVSSDDTVFEAVRHVIALATDPGATRQELNDGRAIAEMINEGLVPIDAALIPEP